eukprot:TRINITY_DN16293_c0_g3_i1.p1 TRINITY_DN16293_c0_g3~~TRINITY_DN16293_c0_g3_i1.p1  ORF type:complete len:401 (-),score=18.74 TRINITY_DN16293_c0_g3_i1:284-1363(-)
MSSEDPTATEAQAKICAAGPHTYVNIGDGGCFQYLDQDGHFIGGDQSRALYTSSHCPFAGADLSHRRSLLVNWYLQALNSSRGTVPFAVNDLAMSCLLGSVQDLPEAFRRPPDVSNEVFCETMLSLPLMFKAIGFDGAGLVMEDNRTKHTFSFKGRVISSSTYRSGPDEDCDLLLDSKRLGEPRLARLALRAVLPTYFLHRYAQSGTGMILKGTRAWIDPSTNFKQSFWQTQADTACKAATSPNELDSMFSLTNLRAQTLVSSEAMARDEGRCVDLRPCNYVSDSSKHLGACDICTKKTHPWFDNATGECWSAKAPSRSRCTIEKPKRRSCTCHKAICWYFTRDFAAAVKAAAKACRVA